MKNILITILILTCINNFIYGQDAEIKNSKRVFTTEAPILKSGKLSEQYDFILQNSDTYNNYKVIRTEWINQYNSNFTDSINKLKTQHTIVLQKNLALENENNALKSEVAHDEELLNEKNNFSFLGIPMSKGVYNGFMWFFLIVFAGAFGYFAYMYKNSHVLTKNAQEKYDELEKEFQEARSRSLEREQLLNRKLFDATKKNNKS